MVSRWRMAALGWMVALLGPPLSAQSEEHYTLGPAPAWVELETVAPLEDVPQDQIVGGTYSLLDDTQQRVDEDGLTTFRDLVRYVHHSEGVQRASQPSIELDPSYQTLTLHAVEVIRDGTVIDQRNPERIQILQREEELEAQLYDGAYTAVITLEDVRPGDWVRTAYSLKGSNPSLDGHYTWMSALASYEPLRKIQHRLLWPEGRPLTVRPHRGAPEPVRSGAGDFVEYRSVAENVQAVVFNDPLPAGYYPYPIVQFSDFAD